MNYTLVLNGLVLRRFDTPEERESFVGEVLWHWWGKGTAHYETDSVVLVDSKTNEKIRLEYGTEK